MKKTFCLTAISVALALCALPHHLMAAQTSQQISIYQKHMESHKKDLLTITKTGKSTIGRDDAEIAIDLIDLVDMCGIQLEHIQDLLLISALVQTPIDKKRIKPIIDKPLKTIVARLDNSLERVNLSIAHVKHQGIMATALKVRDHLRELKGVIDGSN